MILCISQIVTATFYPVNIFSEFTRVYKTSFFPLQTQRKLLQIAPNMCSAPNLQPLERNYAVSFPLANLSLCVSLSVSCKAEK